MKWKSTFLFRQVDADGLELGVRYVPKGKMTEAEAFAFIDAFVRRVYGASATYGVTNIMEWTYTLNGTFYAQRGYTVAVQVG